MLDLCVSYYQYTQSDKLTPQVPNKIHKLLYRNLPLLPTPDYRVLECTVQYCTVQYRTVLRAILLARIYARLGVRFHSRFLVGGISSAGSYA